MTRLAAGIGQWFAIVSRGNNEIKTRLAAAAGQFLGVSDHGKTKK